MADKGLIIKSQVAGWPDWSTESITNPKAREAAEWLISNGYGEDKTVQSVFYDRQTSNMSDDPHAEVNDEINIISVADGIKARTQDTAAKARYSGQEKWKQKNLASIERIEQNVPAEMKAMPHWCAYKIYFKEGEERPKKVILDCEKGGRASPIDNATWTTFDKAADFARRHNCVGLAFSLSGSGLTCIDLDDCVMEGKRSELAWNVLNCAKDTYCERSVSGKGIHVFCHGNLPADYKNRNDDIGLEVYNHARFISVTGKTIEKRPAELAPMGGDMENFLKEKLGKRSLTYDREYAPSARSDNEVIEAIRKSKKGSEFDKLYSGQLLNGDHSRDDFKMLNILAFFTNCDRGQMERIFRSSGLYREDKGDKYLERSIDKAVMTLERPAQHFGGTAAAAKTPKQGNCH